MGKKMNFFAPSRIESYWRTRIREGKVQLFHGTRKENTIFGVFDLYSSVRYMHVWEVKCDVMLCGVLLCDVMSCTS